MTERQIREADRESRSIIIQDLISYCKPLHLETIIISGDYYLLMLHGNKSGATLCVVASSNHPPEIKEEFSAPVMRLTHPNVTNWEINRRLPRFLRENCPQVADALPIEMQRVPTTRHTSAA